MKSLLGKLKGKDKSHPVYTVILNDMGLFIGESITNDKMNHSQREATWRSIYDERFPDGKNVDFSIRGPRLRDIKNEYYLQTGLKYIDDVIIQALLPNKKTNRNDEIINGFLDREVLLDGLKYPDLYVKKFSGYVSNNKDRFLDMIKNKGQTGGKSKTKSKTISMTKGKTKGKTTKKVGMKSKKKVSKKKVSKKKLRKIIKK